MEIGAKNRFQIRNFKFQRKAKANGRGADERGKFEPQGLKPLRVEATMSDLKVRPPKRQNPEADKLFGREGLRPEDLSYRAKIPTLAEGARVGHPQRQTKGVGTWGLKSPPPEHL